MLITKRTHTAILVSLNFIVDKSFELSRKEQLDYLKAMIGIIQHTKKQVIEEKKIHPVHPFIN